MDLDPVVLPGGALASWYLIPPHFLPLGMLGQQPPLELSTILGNSGPVICVIHKLHGQDAQETASVPSLVRPGLSFLGF